MAHTKFPVEVLTPEGEVFNDEVEMLSTRTTRGLDRHPRQPPPLLAMLDPTELRLYKSESEVVRFAQGEGYLQVAHNRALVLVEEATPPDHLDAAELQDKLRGEQDAYEPGRGRLRGEACARQARSGDGMKPGSRGGGRARSAALCCSRDATRLPLAERLIRYDTSTLDGLRCRGRIRQGLARSTRHRRREHDHNGLPVILADVGATRRTQRDLPRPLRRRARPARAVRAAASRTTG